MSPKSFVLYVILIGMGTYIGTLISIRSSGGGGGSQSADSNQPADTARGIYGGKPAGGGGGRGGVMNSVMHLSRRLTDGGGSGIYDDFTWTIVISPQVTSPPGGVIAHDGIFSSRYHLSGGCCAPRHVFGANLWHTAALKTGDECALFALLCPVLTLLLSLSLTPPHSSYLRTSNPK